MSPSEAFRSCPGDLRGRVAAYFNASPGIKAVFMSRMSAAFPDLRSVRRCPGVAEVVRREEESYARVMSRAPLVVEKWFRKRGLDGESLASLHHTHGIDPGIVEAILGCELSSSVHDDYQVAWAIHCEKGRSR